MFMGLRLLEGVSIREFRERFGVDLCLYYKTEIEKLRFLELVEISDGYLRLTEKGLLHGNSVFLEFLP
jgi:oxygen-independent coproporphyrinogen-3 oxidase